jgi:hypothetical protein
MSNTALHFGSLSSLLCGVAASALRTCAGRGHRDDPPRHGRACARKTVPGRGNGIAASRGARLASAR